MAGPDPLLDPENYLPNGRYSPLSGYEDTPHLAAVREWSYGADIDPWADDDDPDGVW